MFGISGSIFLGFWHSLGHVFSKLDSIGAQDMLLTKFALTQILSSSMTLIQVLISHDLLISLAAYLSVVNRSLERNNQAIRLKPAVVEIDTFVYYNTRSMRSTKEK